MAREWKQAIEIYADAVPVLPRRPRVRAAAGQRADRVGRAEGGARDHRVAAQDAPATVDPRIELAEAAAAEKISDFKRMQAAASAAAARGEAQGARLIVARAALLEGHGRAAARRAGAGDRASTSRRARPTREAGDRGRPGAGAQQPRRPHLRRSRDAARAAKMYEEALAIARAIGHQHMVARLLNNLAIQERRAGDSRARWRSTARRWRSAARLAIASTWRSR